MLEKEQQTLRQDIEQFQKAHQHTEPRIREVRRANGELQASIAEKKNTLAEVERAKIEVLDIIRNQTLTRAGLESKLQELDRLKRREDGLKQQLHELKLELKTLDERYQQSENQVESLVREYNDLATKIGIVPPSATYAGGLDYALRPNLDSTASDSEKLFSAETRIKAERAISALRSKLTVTHNETSNERIGLQEELDKTTDQIEEYREHLKRKENLLGASNRKFQEEKEVGRIGGDQRMILPHVIMDKGSHHHRDDVFTLF